MLAHARGFQRILTFALWGATFRGSGAFYRQVPSKHQRNPANWLALASVCTIQPCRDCCFGSAEGSAHSARQTTAVIWSIRCVPTHSGLFLRATVVGRGGGGCWERIRGRGCCSITPWRLTFHPHRGLLLKIIPVSVSFQLAASASSCSLTGGGGLRREKSAADAPGRSRVSGSRARCASATQRASRLHGSGGRALTCLIFLPSMEALVSITNTTFLGTTGRSLGAK